MPKYENGVIYKLCHCNDLENENIYIGSTTNFRSRKYQHKTSCNNEKDKKYNRLVYQFIRNNGGWSEWKMIPIEKYPCNGKEELEIRENYHIQLLKSKLNKQIPTRTRKEYYESNKEIFAEKAKQYRQNNKKKIAEKKKESYENNKQIILEKQKQYHNVNREIILEKQKKYYEANKEKAKQYKKTHYQNNKEILLEKQKQYGKEKIICDHCGCEVRKDGLNRHKKTNKCKNYNITKE